MLCGNVYAHQWTPTYVTFGPSFVSGIYSTKMKLYNARADVDYYQVQVFDGRFNPIKFAISGGENDVVNVRHKTYKYVEVYVPSHEVSRVVYVCTRTMILKKLESATLVSSRVCSKVKNE